MAIPGLGGIFRTARTMGDTSSLLSGGIGARVGRRAVGRGTSKMMQMNVFGLVMWAEFFGFLNTAVAAGSARDVWVGTAVPYAAGYEFGFRNPVGNRRHRPFFFQSVVQAQTETLVGRSSGGGFLSLSGLSASRSGVYAGGRFIADIRSVAKGTVGGRLTRRMAGKEISKFFWGTMKNPTKNMNHVIANRIIQLSRRAARADKLVDTTALVMSIEQGDSFEEWRQRSLIEGLKRSRKAGRTTNRKFTGSTRRALP